MNIQEKNTFFYFINTYQLKNTRVNVPEQQELSETAVKSGKGCSHSGNLGIYTKTKHMPPQQFYS